MPFFIHLLLFLKLDLFRLRERALLGFVWPSTRVETWFLFRMINHGLFRMKVILKIFKLEPYIIHFQFLDIEFWGNLHWLGNGLLVLELIRWLFRIILLPKRSDFLLASSFLLPIELRSLLQHNCLVYLSTDTIGFAKKNEKIVLKNEKIVLKSASPCLNWEEITHIMSRWNFESADLLHLLFQLVQIGHICPIISIPCSAKISSVIH